MVGSGLLEGKVALVTGGGRGVGRDIALQMAAQGASVLVNDLGGSETGEGASESPATEVVREIEAAGGRAAANTDSVAGFRHGAGHGRPGLRGTRRLDIVVNNAGILRDAIFHKMTEDDWDSVIAVHLKGSFNIARAAATVFRGQESGAMIHMTSTSGLIGNFGQANYAAAKLGIVGLSKSIALDMGRFNVRSNCISPFAWSRMIGAIPTDTPEQRARVEKIKQMAPARIAPVAVALASDRAKDVTGQVLAVRNNEIFAMSQSRPLRSVQRGEGWTAEAVLEHAFPAIRAHFYPLDRTADVFSWDPV